MALAPLLVQIRTAGAAALGAAAARFRALGSTVASTSRSMTRHTRQVSSVAGAYRDANGIWRNANGTLLVQRHTVTTVTTAFGRLVRMLHRVRTAALGAAAAIGGVLRRALRAAADAAFNLIRALASWIAMKAPIAAVAIAALPAMASLLGLSQLLAPAVVAVGAAFATWKLATKGFGDALNASDAEELAAALKKLSPSAQSAALTLRDLGREWKTTQQKVQEAFFKGARQDFIMLSHAMQAIADRWLPKLATSFANLRTWMTQVLTAAAVSGQLDTIMAGVKRFVDGITAAIPYLTQAFLDIAEVAAPSLGDLGDKIGSLAQRFADWIRMLKDNGALKAWLDSAKETFQKLIDIGKELGRAIAAIFKGAEGNSFLDNLKNSVTKFADWLESDNGQAVIKFFVDVGSAIANVIVWIEKVVGFFQRGWDALRRDTSGMRDALVAAFAAVGAGMSGMLAIISGGVNAFSWIGGVISRIGGLVAAVRGAVSAINTALSAIRTVINIDIITRHFDSGSKGYAKGISPQGGGGVSPKYYAKGGRVAKGQPIVVGDGGVPELFVPNSAGMIWPRVPSAGTPVSDGRAPSGPAWSGSMSGLDAMFFRWLQAAIRTGKLKLA